MSVRTGPRRESADINRVEQVIRYFLHRSEYLSEQRIHQLMYLMELELIDQGEPLGIDFKPFIDGIHSEEVEKSLTGMNDVSVETVRVSGKRITKYMSDKPPAHLSERDDYIADRLYDEFGDMNSDYLMETIRQTEPFSETKFGEDMNLHSSGENADFDKYTLF
ncbi:hypothetical protein [Natronorarus salvus]|uniref:hypothetical protein n=1 Tax=Natronorarus salvus TaxID=3117733 RepID=UPI002F268E2A